MRESTLKSKKQEIENLQEKVDEDYKKMEDNAYEIGGYQQRIRDLSEMNEKLTKKNLRRLDRIEKLESQIENN